VASAKTLRILLAHVAGAHGIRGDVTLKSYMDDPSDLASYRPLGDETGARRFDITSVRVTTKGVVAHFKGVDQRSDAEALRGTGIYVDRAVLPPAEDGSYYHVDLIGLAAVDSAGTAIGKVIAVENFGAGPMLEIKRTGARETEYVPFTDAFVPDVDISNGSVVVAMPIMVGDPEPNEGRAGDDRE
jgi:16S rRNA processing protein RimM